MPDFETQLQQSWIHNAEAWTDAVRNRRIASRRAGTDAAVLNAIRDFPRCRVLDLGCGEGWLARALTAEGYAVTGVDASQSLIADARKAGAGQFLALSYEDLVQDPDALADRFELIVANFSLLGERIGPLLKAMRSRLSDRGAILIQTLHPLNCGSDERYESGWRIETFAQMSSAFPASMPYYFRTFGSWVEELRAAGLAIVYCREPLSPETGRPLSLLIVARVVI